VTKSSYYQDAKKTTGRESPEGVVDSASMNNPQPDDEESSEAPTKTKKKRQRRRKNKKKNGEQPQDQVTAFLSQSNFDENDEEFQ
jgi:hypothetical protein